MSPSSSIRQTPSSPHLRWPPSWLLLILAVIKYLQGGWFGLHFEGTVQGRKGLKEGAGHIEAQSAHYVLFWDSSPQNGASLIFSGSFLPHLIQSRNSPSGMSRDLSPASFYTLSGRQSILTITVAKEGLSAPRLWPVQDCTPSVYRCADCILLAPVDHFPIGCWCGFPKRLLGSWATHNN